VLGLVGEESFEALIGREDRGCCTGALLVGGVFACWTREHDRGGGDGT